MLKISVYDQRSRAPLKSNPASATVPIVESLNMMIGILSSCHSFYDGSDEKPLLMPWNLLISLSRSHEGITFPTLHDSGRFIGLCLIMHQDITYDNILINNHRKTPLSVVWTQNLGQPFQFDTTSWTTPKVNWHKRYNPFCNRCLPSSTPLLWLVCGEWFAIACHVQNYE